MRKGITSIYHRSDPRPECVKTMSFCSVAATLTSYSENMERGGKYGEGSRGNLKLWQSQKSGMDSFLYRVDENMTASTYSLNKIPERNLESMSSHSAHSIPLYLMPRPNSVAGESLPLSLPLRWKDVWCRVLSLVKLDWADWVMLHPISDSLMPPSLLSSFLSLLVSFLDELWSFPLNTLSISVPTNVAIKLSSQLNSSRKRRGIYYFWDSSFAWYKNPCVVTETRLEYL